MVLEMKMVLKNSGISLKSGLSTFLSLVSIVGRAFSDKVDRLKLAEIVKQAIEEKTHLQDSR